MAELTFLLPDLGEGLVDAEIVGWRVAVGEHVELNQIVAEVVTAKVSVEIPSPYAGIVKALHAAPSDKVGVGDPLITFEVGGDQPGIVGHVPTEPADKRRVRLTPPPPRS
jgi:pyruvate dehydrogenase E2 component (dihydrolipoamide acetyltransferase)